MVPCLALLTGSKSRSETPVLLPTKELPSAPKHRLSGLGQESVERRSRQADCEPHGYRIPVRRYKIRSRLREVRSPPPAPEKRFEIWSKLSKPHSPRRRAQHSLSLLRPRHRPLLGASLCLRAPPSKRDQVKLRPAPPPQLAVCSHGSDCCEA